MSFDFAFLFSTHEVNKSLLHIYMEKPNEEMWAKSLKVSVNPPSFTFSIELQTPY